MKKINIFVRSIITGFRDRRSAVFQAIHDLHKKNIHGYRLNIIKVHYDDIAEPTSPQETCLDRVRASDIYIGVFGNKYGKQNPKTKMSPVHEECTEAYRTGKDILLFVEKGKKEIQQQKFIRRVGNYSSGRKYCEYSDCKNLKDRLYRSLESLLISKKEKHETRYYDLLPTDKRY